MLSNFWRCFASAKRAFLRTYHELSRWLDAIYEDADVQRCGDYECYTLNGLVFKVFQAACGIVIFFDDGIAWYACKPAIPCTL